MLMIYCCLLSLLSSSSLFSIIRSSELMEGWVACAPHGKRDDARREPNGFPKRDNRRGRDSTRKLNYKENVNIIYHPTLGD